MIIYAVPLFEEDCDYVSAAHARRGLLSNDAFHMERDDLPYCPILHMAKWKPLRATDLPDGTLVTIRYRHRSNSGNNSANYHQITVQLGRCKICGDRIDAGKSPACAEPACQKAWEKKQGKKEEAKSSREDTLASLIKAIPKEKLMEILATVEAGK